MNSQLPNDRVVVDNVFIVFIAAKGGEKIIDYFTGRGGACKLKQSPLCRHVLFDVVKKDVPRD